ncbi:MAG: hypothetical protein IT381_25945 [Deltaproteobacteria bacterium]|nr:hypothetical protein [Deltaproteobacteria bacterium]
MTIAPPRAAGLEAAFSLSFVLRELSMSPTFLLNRIGLANSLCFRSGRMTSAQRDDRSVLIFCDGDASALYMCRDRVKIDAFGRSRFAFDARATISRHRGGLRERAVCSMSAR